MNYLSDEQIIEQFAKAKGIPVEEAKAKYLPLLKRPDEREQIKRQFLDAAEIIQTASEASKDANPMLKNYMATLAGQTITQVVGGGKASMADRIGEVFDKLTEKKLEYKLLNRIFKDEEEEAKPNPEIEAIKQTVDGVLGQLSQLSEALTAKKKNEEKAEILAELDNKIKPIREFLEAYRSKLEGNGEQMRSIDTMLQNIKKYEDDAKEFLTKRGYNVDVVRGMTKEEVQKLLEEERGRILEKLSPEEIKAALEKRGFKIVGGPMSYDEFMRRLEEERKKWQDEKIADRQIAAVENMVSKSVDRLIGEIVGPLMRGWVEGRTQQTPPSGLEPQSGEEPQGEGE